MRHLMRGLDLESDQQRAISEILARHQSEVDATWRAMQPPVRATLDSTSREIEAVLRPEQAAKYRRMMETTHGSSHR
jgi:hypothetical protein